MFKVKLIISVSAIVFLVSICDLYSQEIVKVNKTEFAISQAGEETDPQTNLFKLHNSVPSSYDNVTIIEFELGEEANVLLTVCNSKGEIVETLVNDLMDSGDYTVNYKSREKIVTGELTYKLEVKSISGVKNVFAVK
ncbi:MAG: hypothetical protein JSS91_02205 [Bacteroidetes bacterium]|nr:hypothetical protein [Bacteroidota bacterium]